MSLFKKPTAFVPLAMSGAAIVLIASYIVLFGTARQADEGTAAHLWQFLMAGQVPVILVFAAKWLPEKPGEAVRVLALHALAVLLAAVPVWWFQW